MNKLLLKYFTPIIIFLIICGWGAAGHKIINRKTFYSFPASMSPFSWFSDSLAKHGSDADYRKSSDPTESPRHFIDIDNYPEFIATGRIPQTLDSLIAIHGNYFVIDNGILPFAIIATTDSVKKYFQLHDWQKAMLKAADLGHYVGDAHMPLHLTRNYDGQYTNQTGVHSRYETQMINADSSLLIYTGDSCNYVSDVPNYVFGFIYNDYKYVDSVLKADSISRAIAGNYGSVYLQQLWQRTSNFTISLFKNASNILTRLIYTAWVNAGSPIPTSITQNGTIAGKFALHQNFPNPFNPTTKIKFEVAPSYSFRNTSIDNQVLLIVYDAMGHEVQTLLSESLKPGSYEISFNGSSLSSGIYYYSLIIKSIGKELISTKKMALIK